MDSEEAPYWTQARVWARGHTKTYTPAKAIPPALAAILQFFLSREPAVTQTLLTLAIIFGGYFLLYGLEFTWNLLFRAPVALDKERRETIKQLKIKPYDVAVMAEVERVFQRLNQESKDLLRYLLLHGETEEGLIPSGNSATERQRILHNCQGVGFVKRRTERIPGYALWEHWKIVEQFEPALQDLIFPRSSSS